MEKKLATSLLQKVRDDYNTIAKEWNEKRSQVHPLRVNLLKRIPARACVLDAGCGNGIVYEFLGKKSIAYTGVDVSSKLIAIARRRAQALHGKGSFQFKVGSILKLPFKDNTFSHVLCLSMLHHLPGEAVRKQAMREMFRVLKPEGKLILSVWNLLSDYARQKFYIDEQIKNTRAGFDAHDVLIPWRATPGKVVERYIHVFTRDELYALARGAGFKHIRIAFYDKQTGKPSTVRKTENITLIAKK